MKAASDEPVQQSVGCSVFTISKIEPRYKSIDETAALFEGPHLVSDNMKEKVRPRECWMNSVVFFKRGAVLLAEVNIERVR
jgi:hypothetical protein